jgi:hypothetical protein
MTDMTMAAPPRTSAASGASGASGEQPTMVRWGARAAVAAPLVAVFSIASGIPILTDDMREVGGSARWLLATGAALAVLVLLAVALVGLHRAQEAALSRFGHASALLALAGTVLAAGGAWDTFITVTYLADVAPAVLDRATDGALLAGYIVSYLVFCVGWACFAVATLRAKALSRGPAIVLLIGAVLAFVPAPTAMRLLLLSIAVALLATRRR